MTSATVSSATVFPIWLILLIIAFFLGLVWYRQRSKRLAGLSARPIASMTG
jgi:fumarate reductase subunit D